VRSRHSSNKTQRAERAKDNVFPTEWINVQWGAMSTDFPNPPIPSSSVMQGGQSPPRPRGNGAAVASLIFGILGCIPEVTGLLAIILAVIALRRTRNPNVGGKGLAAAGLTLGILSVVAWSIGLTLAGIGWSNSGPARAAARQYLADYSHHDIRAILSESTHTMRQSQVEQLDDHLRALGNLQDVSFVGIYFGYPNGTPQCRLNGTARYTNGEARFIINLVRIDERWKVNGFWIDVHPRNVRPQLNNMQA
jgi:hypothetical protein